MAEIPKHPKLRLPSETVQKLKAASGNYRRAKEDIEKLKKLGVDVSDLESKIEDTEVKRKSIIELFG